MAYAGSFSPFAFFFCSQWFTGAHRDLASTDVVAACLTNRGTHSPRVVLLEFMAKTRSYEFQLLFVYTKKSNGNTEMKKIYLYFLSKQPYRHESLSIRLPQSHCRCIGVSPSMHRATPRYTSSSPAPPPPPLPPGHRLLRPPLPSKVIFLPLMSIIKFLLACCYGSS